MVINVGFTGKNGRELNPSAARAKATAVQVTNDNRKLYERIAESRNLANRYKADFESTLSALRTANADIDRLNAEIAELKSENVRLNSEVCRLNQDLAKKRSRTKKETDSSN